MQAIVDAIAADNAIYGRVLGDPAGLGIRLGIEQAIASFLDAIERGEPPAAQTDELWRRLGEAEFQAGRPLEALRAAFRTGARAAWRAAAELAAEVGISTTAVVALAEGIFVYSDALAADVVEGYLRMQSDEAGERERRRRRLGSLLLDPAGVEAEALERAAELAGWPLPRSIAVLAVAGESAGAVARRLGADALSGAEPDGAWVVVPDPRGPGRVDAVDRAVLDAGVAAALGPAVAPARAAASLRWARATLELAAQGAIAARGPLHAEDHLGALVVGADRELAAHLRRLRLGPLLALPAGERARLLETLTAWLAHQRHTPAVAAELNVHPQTVRYRLGKLRELLGEALQTPAGRFELELALRAPAAGA